MVVTINQLRMAALLMNTQRDLPKVAKVLEKYGAKRVSEVRETDRLACLLDLLETKMAARHAIWSMMH